jgi:hypothetical protein
MGEADPILRLLFESDACIGAMHVPAKRTLAIGAAVAVAAAGGGAAVAATTGGSTHNDFLDSVAKHLGISRQKLDDATKAAAIDQVDAQLKAGRITQAQADALKKRIESGAIPPLARGVGGRDLGLGVPGARGLLKAGVGDALTAAAKYLGLSESDLRTKLGNGQSLADIAKAQGKDAAGLQQAVLDAAKADLDKAVADQKLTQAQADDIYNGLKSRIADIVNGQLRFRGPGHPGKAFFGDTFAAAAKYLGLSKSDLRSKLASGQSLADVAKAQSKDVNGLEDAIVSAQKAALDKVVSDKKLTQAQADTILSNLKDRVGDLVNAKPGDRPAFRGRFHAGPRFFFGP